METPQISYFPVCIRVELEETQFWSLSQFWELLAENRTAVLPHIRGEGRSGVTPCFQFVHVTLPIYSGTIDERDSGTIDERLNVKSE